MNPKLLTAFLVAALSSGCVIYSREGGGGGGGGNTTPPPQPGNVTFTWSFAGVSCNDAPQVKSVKVDIPGETLQNAGVYPCLANGYPGITLHDFAGGSYTYTLEARGYGNELLFVSSGAFAVNGDVRVTSDLTPAGGPNSYAYLTWRFPPNQTATNPTCLQAGVSHVEAIIDGVSKTYDCAQGQTSPGAATPFLVAGTHSITLVGKNQSGYVYYRYSGSLQTFSGAPAAADYALNWAVGGASVKWSITNGTLGETCGQAGIADMYVNFKDSTGKFVYGTDGDKQSCTAASVEYNFLPPGTYQVYVAGYGTGNALYSSNQATPPTVTVTAGVFVDGSSPLNVQVFRQ